MGEPNNYKNLGETVAKLRCDGAWNDVAPERKLAVVCTREIDITSNKEIVSIDYQPTVWRGLVDQKKCRGISQLPPNNYLPLCYTVIVTIL